ncbi:MAG TPA: type II toxin-antitoxin system PemK/MazF family toxin [Syntrophorhabdaceae bacterium]|nr:type II toxin-antitoxin system PemK/MazF family toxin [Syntrophorhabdaceae bacterium]HQM81328.1 type II toxin-antitoxin system PemK/MazF family toxin [Syntrophorhabdaceae bacterium]
MEYKWTIFMANLNPVTGSEQRGTRPVIVVSDEIFNSVMPVVTVLPVTSLKEGRKVYPNEVLLNRGQAGVAQDSIILAHQVRTIAKERLSNKVGSLSDAGTREKVKGALKIHLNL